MISAIAHAVVVLVVAIPALLATDVLPDPPEMLAFVVDVAPVPPPTPPALVRVGGNIMEP